VLWRRALLAPVFGSNWWYPEDFGQTPPQMDRWDLSVEGRWRLGQAFLPLERILQLTPRANTQLRKNFP
jgi:hypothetical protein